MSSVDRRIREKEARKKLIMNVSTSLFSEKEYNFVTIEKIATKAEVSKGLIYFYFKSKNDIYFQIIKEGYHDLNKLVDAVNLIDIPHLEKLELLIKEYSKFVYHNFDLISIIDNLVKNKTNSDMFNDKEKKELLKLFMQFNQGCKKIVIPCLANSILKITDYSTILLLIFKFVYIFIGKSEYKPNDKEFLNNITNEIIEILFHGILK